LAGLLYGGSATSAEIESNIANDGYVKSGGMVCLAGSQDLLEDTIRRSEANSKYAAVYQELAIKYSRELASHCPFLLAAAAAGSMTTNGVDIGDDVDLNLLVEDGTKYVTYLASLLLGLKYSLRYGEALGNGGLRKLICVNVVWTRSDTRPFIRQDDSLAFELMLSEPLVGSDEFRRVLERNRWVERAFPQAFRDRGEGQSHPPPSVIGRALVTVLANPRLRAVADKACRLVAWSIYAAYHWIRRNDGEAKARLELVKRVKYPYEVFQD